MAVRKATKSDIPHWSRMRNSLWPGSVATNDCEIEHYFSRELTGIRECYLAVDNGTPVGFIELNIRNCVEGSSQPEVPYVEGWYIDEAYRGRGLGRLLMKEAEAWAINNGFSELASDADLENEGSIAAHKKLGFAETDRIVCFLKNLYQRA